MKIRNWKTRVVVAGVVSGLVEIACLCATAPITNRFANASRAVQIAVAAADLGVAITAGGITYVTVVDKLAPDPVTELTEMVDISVEPDEVQEGEGA